MGQTYSQAPWKQWCEREGCVPRGIAQVPGTMHIDWQRCYEKKPFSKNLIKNSCGEDGFQHWQKTDGGHGWAIEENCTEVPGATSQKCFVSSFGWCSKEQTVDLLAEGLWEEILDIHQPAIHISDWYGGRPDCGFIYEIKVCLLAADKRTVIATFENNPPSIRGGDVSYHKVSFVFCNYGKGVRYVKFFHRGKDTRFWAGHYGARVTNSTVKVSLSKTAD